MNSPSDDQQGRSGPSPYQQPRGTREPGEDVPRQHTPQGEQASYGDREPYGEQPSYGESYGEREDYGQAPPQGPYGRDSSSYGGYAAYPPGADAGYETGYGYPSDGDSYLNGAPVGFGQAVAHGLRNLLTFRGRASRSAFWWFVLFSVIIQIIVNVLVGIGTTGSRSPDSYLGLITTVLTLSLSVRRLHDANHRGWWWLIGLVPFVGWIVLLVFYLQRGTRGPNRFNVRG
jgi:uncharacterized membrane protein YhaH (DUF805 family)